MKIKEIRPGGGCSFPSPTGSLGEKYIFCLHFAIFFFHFHNVYYFFLIKSNVTLQSGKQRYNAFVINSVKRLALILSVPLLTLSPRDVYYFSNLKQCNIIKWQTTLRWLASFDCHKLVLQH